MYILSLVERLSLLTPNVVKLGHNGTSDAQVSVYLWVGVAFGVYIRAQVGKLYCLIVHMNTWSISSYNILDLCFMPVCVETHNAC